MSDAANRLREARKLIERGWCQDHYAETASGRECHWLDDVAAKWCILGAINHANGCLLFSSEPEIILSGAVGRQPLGAWNDEPGRTQAEVLAAFDKAIALAESENAQ